MRRLRDVATRLLLLVQMVLTARVDSGDFGSVMGQITKGNRMEQCPCVRPPEGGACISYDSRYQASHIEEAMVSFVDLSLPDREKLTDADSLSCVSVECRSCFSLLFYRILEVGLLPQNYRPTIPVLPKAALRSSMCPRLRFPSANDYASATSSLAAPSAAVAGLIERGARFERAAQAAQAASEAISRGKDEQSKNGNHPRHGQHDRKHQQGHDSHINLPQTQRASKNNNQLQVTGAQQMGQGRSGPTLSPSRQFTVQQQLRVQQPPWQQQQQWAQQSQQQQQQLNTQQQFNNQQQFSNQFNPQQQLSNAGQLLQTANQINSIAEAISMATHAGTHYDRLNKWNADIEHGGHGGPDRPTPQPQEPNFGSSEETNGYHDHPGQEHHHENHHQQLTPGGPGGDSPLPFFGNNAGMQAGAGPQVGLPGAFPGSGGFGGGQGGGFGGGGGGGNWNGHFGWRRTRSSPFGVNQQVEMDVVSPLVSPLIPKELRPVPVEVSFNDAEHFFSEERSAFAELVRDKRQMEQQNSDGILGSRFTIACFDRGESENGGNDKMLSLCGGCWVWRRLPEGFFPPIVNELICKKEDRCLSGWGRCVDKTRSVNVLRKVKGQWTAAALSTGTCCDCKVVAGSEIHSLILG